MQKIIALIKNRKFQFISAGIIVIVLIIFAIVKFVCNSPKNTTGNINQKDSVKITANLKNLDNIKPRIEKDIDSIFASFGIKKEWVTTSYPNDTTKKKKDDKVKRESPKVVWFAKTVQIPKDLSTSEINLDLTNYINSLGLTENVIEDIKTKDIVFVITDTIKTEVTLAKISINHSDKITRENSVYAVIVNKIWDYSKKDAEEVSHKISEFSFLFPANLDELEMYNLYTQAKKDVMLNITIGDRGNNEADFRIGMFESEIKLKVKSIKTDFSSVKTVLLNKISAEIPDQRFYSIIQIEFKNEGITAVKDSTLINAPKDAASVLNIIKSSNKKIILINEISFDELMKFYEQVLVMKKLGNKFYTLTEYLTKEEDSKKKANEQELKKQETDKKKTEQKKPEPKKNEPKKKEQPKKTPKKDVKKK